MDILLEMIFLWIEDCFERIIELLIERLFGDSSL
jgi:hypothetical protein